MNNSCNNYPSTRVARKQKRTRNLIFQIKTFLNAYITHSSLGSKLAHKALGHDDFEDGFEVLTKVVTPAPASLLFDPRHGGDMLHRNIGLSPS
jgi:hypothetical protein